MKKIILLSAIALYSVTAFAQKGSIKGSIVAGVNVAIPVGAEVTGARADITTSETNAQKNGGTYSGSITPLIGIHLGGTVFYFITDKIAVGSGVIFSQRGYKIKTSSEYPKTFQYGNPSQTFAYSTKSSSSEVWHYNYMDIPITGKFYLSNNFYINPGLQFCLLVSDSWTGESEDADIDTTPNPPVVKSTTTTTTGGAYGKGLLIGFQLGAGVSGKKIGFNFGISKTGRPAIFGLYGYQNLTLQAGLTYSFDLKKGK